MNKQRRSEEHVTYRLRRDRQQGRFHVVRCDGCGRLLHTTHHFVLYGNLCRPCWLAAQNGEGANDGVRDEAAFPLD